MITISSVTVACKQPVRQHSGHLPYVQSWPLEHPVHDQSSTHTTSYGPYTGRVLTGSWWMRLLCADVSLSAMAITSFIFTPRSTSARCPSWPGCKMDTNYSVLSRLRHARVMVIYADEPSSITRRQADVLRTSSDDHHRRITADRRTGNTSPH